MRVMVLRRNKNQYADLKNMGRMTTVLIHESNRDEALFMSSESSASSARSVSWCSRERNQYADLKNMGRMTTVLIDGVDPE